MSRGRELWARLRRAIGGRGARGPAAAPAVPLYGDDDDATRVYVRLRQRAVIANRTDGGVLFWLAKLYGFVAITVVVALVTALVATYGYFARAAPPTPDLTRYARVVPAVSRIYAADGTVLGEFANEWRQVVPYDEIPPALVNAFLAAEDHEFFSHHGIYFKGIARAAWRNLTAGDFAQGGSTITQQVAKQFLGNEKSLTRKAKEAIVARRLEASYSKQAILSVYLNQIFLGNGAYGVEAAAERYFGKKLAALDVGEMAMIAGLAQAPSRFSPIHDPAAARERRNQVLDKMVRYGFLAAADGDRWKAAPLVTRSRKDVFGEISPYYAEEVRRHVVATLGQDALMNGGLRIETAVEPVTDALAYDSLDFGAHKQDKRQGWRGPEAYLDEGRPRELFRTRAAKLYGAGPLDPDRRYLGLVEQVSAGEATIRVGGATYALPVDNAKWAAPWSRDDSTNDHTIGSLTGVLKVGDVVWVQADTPVTAKYQRWILDEGRNPRWLEPDDAEHLARERAQRAGRVVLDQVPHPQSAIFTADHHTGYVVAMVGGTDYHRSQYNRATQACRQPGSTYKPIYYSAALDQGYGYDTALNDVPRAEVDPITGEIWMPKNLGGTMDVVVNLEYAMVFSKNVPSVALFGKIGAANVERWARQLGFTTKIIADRALALGASCTLIHELTRAFAIFARNGRWIDWVFVRRIVDRDGRIIEDHTVYYDPLLGAGDRLDRLAATAGDVPKQVIPPRAAYLTSKLLAQTIEYGFSSVIRRAELNVAGKTGTSSATMDTTFVAYTSRWITTAWMGDDLRERPLGHDDAAYMVVEPMWARYMIAATQGHPNAKIPWEVPRGVNPSDRGDKKGAQHDMPLVYRKPVKPEDLPPGLQPLPDEG